MIKQSIVSTDINIIIMFKRQKIEFSSQENAMAPSGIEPWNRSESNMITITPRRQSVST